MSILIKGRSGKYYFFQSFNINESIDKGPCDVYVFVRKVKVNTQNFNSASFFQPINPVTVYHEALNEDTINKAKQKQATSILCLLPDQNLITKEVVEDLREDDSYKIKVEES